MNHAQPEIFGDRAKQIGIAVCRLIDNGCYHFEVHFDDTYGWHIASNAQEFLTILSDPHADIDNAYDRHEKPPLPWLEKWTYWAHFD